MSETGVTGMPLSARRLAVPPVDTISTSMAVNALQNSTTPSLSDRLTSARETFLGSSTVFSPLGGSAKDKIWVYKG